MGTPVSGVPSPFCKGLNSIKWKQSKSITASDQSGPSVKNGIWLVASRTPAPTFTLLSPSEAWQLEVPAVAQRSSPWLGDLNPQLLRLFLNRKMSPLHSSHLRRAAEWLHKKGKGAGVPRSTTGPDYANTSRAQAGWARGQCPYPKREPRKALSQAALP